MIQTRLRKRVWGGEGAGWGGARDKCAAERSDEEGGGGGERQMRSREERRGGGWEGRETYAQQRGAPRMMQARLQMIDGRRFSEKQMKPQRGMTEP
jgi:hypothetical protein